MEPRPLWKLFCWVTFIEEFREVRAAMEEGNGELGIISSFSYYVSSVYKSSHLLLFVYSISS